jgi:hypothetical protein
MTTEDIELEEMKQKNIFKAREFSKTLFKKVSGVP